MPLQAKIRYLIELVMDAADVLYNAWPIIVKVDSCLGRIHCLPPAVEGGPNFRRPTRHAPQAPTTYNQGQFCGKSLGRLAFGRPAAWTALHIAGDGLQLRQGQKRRGLLPGARSD
jgi:hypothetical protein